MFTLNIQLFRFLLSIVIYICACAHSIAPDSTQQKHDSLTAQVMPHICTSPFDYLEIYLNSMDKCQTLQTVCVCVEVLRPSQPIGVMSSAVRLLTILFTGQS